MSRKTRKMMWSVPLVAVVAAIGALALFMTLAPGGVLAQDATLGPPTGLTATADGQTAIKLSWTAPAGEVIGYRIDVSKDGEVWEAREPANSANITIVGNIGRYTDMGLKGGNTRHYRVFAIDSTGDEGEPTAPVSATTDPATKSASPRNLAISTDPEVTADTITLEWGEPPATGGSDITAYKVQRSSTGASGWSDLKTLPIVDTDLMKLTGDANYGYTDKGLMASTTWHYRVIAVNGVGDSDPSNTVSQATEDAAEIGAPTNLQVQGSDNQVTLYWVAPANQPGAPVTGYRIERRETTSDSWKPIVSNTGSKATVYRAGGAIHTADATPNDGDDNAVRWQYQVAAINAAGTGPFITPVGDADNLPNAATHGPAVSLKATAVDRQSIRLTWNMPPVGGTTSTSYRIFASKDGNSWTVTEQPTPQTDESYDHTGLKAGEKWYYLVFATTTDQHRVSARATATTLPAQTPGAPTLAVVDTDGITANQINLVITAPTDDGGAKITGYQIRRSEDQITWETLEANFDHDDDLDAENIQYFDKKLSASTEYHYEVRAVNSAGAGAAAFVSGITLGTLALGIPDGLVAIARSGARVDLYWLTPSDPTGNPITGYWIEVSEDSGTTWSNVVSDTGSKATTYTHMGAPAGKDLTYRVSAINSGGAGVASVNEDVMTPVSTELGEPTMVAARSDAAGEVTITWMSGVNADSHDIVLYSGSPDYDIVDEAEDVSGNTHTFTGVAAGRYAAVVISAQGTSEWDYSLVWVTVQ